MNIKKILFLLFIIFQVSCQRELIPMPREGSLDRYVQALTLRHYANHYLDSINKSTTPKIDLKVIEDFSQAGALEYVDKKLIAQVVAKLALFVIEHFDSYPRSGDSLFGEREFPESSYWHNNKKVFQIPFFLSSLESERKKLDSVRLEKVTEVPDLVFSSDKEMYLCSKCNAPDTFVDKRCSYCKYLWNVRKYIELAKSAQSVNFIEALIDRAIFLQYLYKFVKSAPTDDEINKFFNSIDCFLLSNSFISDDFSTFSILKRMLLFCELLSLKCVPACVLASVSKIFALAVCLPVEKIDGSWVYMDDELKNELECLLPSLKRINPDMDFGELTNYIPQLKPPDSFVVLPCHSSPSNMRNIIRACRRKLGGFEKIDFTSPVVVRSRIGSRVSKAAAPIDKQQPSID